MWGLLQLVFIVSFCPPHNAWERIRRGESDIVVDPGERIARPGEAIFSCERPHATGPIVWHFDLDCYCAPASVSPQDVATRIGGTCVADKLHPTSADNWGACRYSRCNHDLEF